MAEHRQVDGEEEMETTETHVQEYNETDGEIHYQRAKATLGPPKAPPPTSGFTRITLTIERGILGEPPG